MKALQARAHRMKGTWKTPLVNRGLAEVSTVWTQSSYRTSAKLNRINSISARRSIELLGVHIDNVTMNEALDFLMNSLNRHDLSEKAKSVSFVNADCVNLYVNDPQYRDILNANDRVFADGVGVRIAASWTGEKVKDNVNGTDLFPLLCEKMSLENKKVYLYGAQPNVVKKVAQKLEHEYPGLTVVGYQNGYSNSQNPEKVCQDINRSQADILFVALGAPRQEKWIAQNQHRLNVKVAMGVGGLFDFYSGSVSRAPLWMRNHSLEWVWRLIQQPRDKAKRYLIGNPVFLYRAFKAALHIEKALAIRKLT